MDIMNLFSNLVNWVLGFLPDSPITWVDNSPAAQFIGYMNYFIPIDFMLSSAEVWLSAVIAYYIYSAVLRWIRAVS